MPIETFNSTLQMSNNAEEISWAESVRLFLQDCKFRNLSPTTVDYYKFHLIGLERF